MENIQPDNFDDNETIEIHKEGVWETAYDAAKHTILSSLRELINNVKSSLAMTFLNKCDESEIDIYKEYFQRTFGEDF